MNLMNKQNHTTEKYCIYYIGKVHEEDRILPFEQFDKIANYTVKDLRITCFN